jgi:hypothetical protein
MVAMQWALSLSVAHRMTARDMQQLLGVLPLLHRAHVDEDLDPGRPA